MRRFEVEDRKPVNERGHHEYRRRAYSLWRKVAQRCRSRPPDDGRRFGPATDGMVAVKGWTETSGLSGMDFCKSLQEIGVKTVICTDIARDGAMAGANRALYSELMAAYSMDFIASGGVSSLEDIRALKEQNLYGAIIGKAYYTGAIDLAAAIREGAI